ncbi:hypothetical protein [Salinimicrobium sp. GXAS 041]|uniref:hypothetical protein n=1 Tax=Salinimicrobium sp. GXAS 041 TaxID=3400806 RepID=UPI003C72084D
MRIVLLTAFLFISTICSAQSLEELEDFSVDKIYKKIEVDYGTLDDEGDEIEYILVETELDSGIYEIELTDGPGDTYEVKGTDIFITFDFYFGYAGYGTECYMEVTNGYSPATVYKKE